MQMQMNSTVITISLPMPPFNRFNGASFQEREIESEIDSISLQSWSTFTFPLPL